jgi:hypothetical protein
MIRNEICCDVCGLTVARKDGTIFARYRVIRQYIEVPCRGIGVSCDDGYFPSETTKHICENCMEKFVFRALDEKKEQ